MTSRKDFLRTLTDLAIAAGVGSVILFFTRDFTQSLNPWGQKFYVAAVFLPLLMIVRLVSSWIRRK